MYVVSDATPIISLLKINQIHILKKIFNEVVVPDAVYKEITSNKGKFCNEFKLFTECDFIKRRTVKNQLAVKVLRSQAGLDTGESESIALVSEFENSVLIIDELKGRKVALEMGIRITGTLGILLKAKKMGVINKLKPLLNDMMKNNIRISDNLYNSILSEANEI